MNALCLLDENLLSDWKIYLVGPIEPQFKTWLDEKLKNSAIKDKFILTGNISDKKRLNSIYAKSAIFALPSRVEGFPLVLPEALNHGCYPITTNCFDSADEMILPGYGDIIDSEEKTWAATLARAIKNQKQNEEHSAKATEFINANFDWKMIAKKLETYLNECD